MSKKSSTFAPEIGDLIDLFDIRPAKHISNAGVRLKRIAGRKTHNRGGGKERGNIPISVVPLLFSLTA